MIEIETADGVARLRLTHGKANVLDVTLLEALADAFANLEVDSDVEAVVVTGNGRLFSAGVDLFQVVEGGETYVRRFLPLLGSTLERLFRFPKPVVAAVEGHAIAGGLIVAMAADRVLMATGDGRVGLTELRVGVPFPSMPIEIVRYRLGTVAAARLVMDARNVDSQQAAAIGVVDALVAGDGLLAEADAIARDLAKLPPDAFALTKQQLRSETVARAQAADDEAVLAIWSSAAGQQRIAAFLEKTVGKRDAERRS